MGYGYGVELKKRVLAYLDAGHAKVEACQVFGVSRRAVYKWLELQTKTGQVLPPRRGQRRRKLDKEQLLKVLAQHPDAYAREVGHRLGASPQAILKACQRWGITRKKSLIFQRKRQESAQRVSGKNPRHSRRKPPLPRRKRH